MSDKFRAQGAKESEDGLAGLLSWLREQKGGAGTFYEFQTRAEALRRTETSQAAFLGLAGNLAGRFADAFEAQPLPVPVANQALAQLVGFTQRAIELNGAERRYVDLLNEIGASDLAPQPV